MSIHDSRGMRRVMTSVLVLVSLVACDRPTGSEAPEARLPDLAVTSVEVPEVASPERDLDVGFTYANRGDSIAEAKGVHRIWLSEDDVQDDNDILIGAVEPVALGGGASDRAAITFSIPADFREAAYSLIISLDATHLIEEVNENNNDTRPDSAIQIRRAPNLVIRHFAAASDTGTWHGDYGLYIETGFTIGNQGTKAAPEGYRHRIYLSHDKTLSSDDKGIGGGCCYAIDRVIEGNRTFEYDHDYISPGDYWVILQVESANDDDFELDTSDNTAATRITVPQL